MFGDIRIAVRALRSWRWGALMAVATLAVGIGTTTALYALLRVALSDVAPRIDEVERVARIYGTNPALGVGRSPVTLDDFDTRLIAARSFQSIAAYQHVEMAVGSDATAETVSAMRVSPAFFEVLRGRPIEGRLFTPADTEDAPTAVVSELTWRRRFAGRRIEDEPSIRLDGREHAVVGVLPASFSFPFIGVTADVWVPFVRRDASGDPRVMVIATLAGGSTWAAAIGELSTLAAPLQQEGAWRWRAIPVQQDMQVRTTGAAVWVLLPAAVVLIVGCVNVACMLLARGIRRETELCVRMALGATRGAIFRQLLVENVLLAVAAGIAGTALAAAGVDAIVRTLIALKPEEAAKLSRDFGLLPIAVTTSVAACLIFGLVPALSLSRREVASSLKGSAPAARVKIAGYGARDLVVFAELALAVVLVMMTAMSFSVVDALQDTRIGFAAHELVAVGLPARDAAAAAERVRSVGGVTGVALVSSVPGGRGAMAMASAPGGQAAPVSIIGAGEGFFDTAGLPIVQGRSFLPTETAGAAVAIVSETGASTLWPDEHAIGRHVDVKVRGKTTRLVVIGIAQDALRLAVRRPQPPDIYRPLDTAAASEILLLARSSSAKEIARHVGAAARPRDAIAPTRARVLGERLGIPADGVTIVRLFGAFALIALLLAGSGIFAIVSQSMAQRTSEFGVRLALGATPRRILRMVLTREMTLIAAALASGTITTAAMTRSSGFDDAAFILAVSMSRPLWSVALVGLCGAVAATACGLATYRIVKLDPSVVLRRN